MKYSTKLSDAVHIMVFIVVNPTMDLSSTTIAESIRTNPAYVRQLMMKLKKAGLLSGTRGKAKPELMREPRKISLLDMYRAIEGNKPLLHLDTHTNPECAAGVNIQLALQKYYDMIQQTAEEEMAKLTLEDVIREYYQRITANGFEV